MDHISQMPNDLQRLLQLHLHPLDLLNLRLTCKKRSVLIEGKLFNDAKYFKYRFDQKLSFNREKIDIKSECGRITIQLLVSIFGDHIKINIESVTSELAIEGNTNIFKFKLPEALRNIEGGSVKSVMDWQVLSMFDLRINLRGTELTILDDYGEDINAEVALSGVNFEYTSYFQYASYYHK